MPEYTISGTLIDLEVIVRSSHAEPDANPAGSIMGDLMRALIGIEGASKFRVTYNTEEQKCSLSPLDGVITRVMFTSNYDPARVPRIVEANKECITFTLSSGIVMTPSHCIYMQKQGETK